MSSFFTRLTSIALVLACLTQVSASAAPVKSELDEGVKLYQAKNYQAARLAFEKIIKANPSSWQAQYYMANTCLALGQWPQAKYCYQVCMHYCKDPGTQAQCQAGIDSIEKFSQAKSAAPATPASSTSAKAPAKGDDDDDEDANLSPAKANIERQKAQVMEEARKETAKIRKAAKDQIETEKNSSNEIFKYGDGHHGLDISDEREREIMKEADEKCAQVMKNAELRCRGFH